MNQNRKISERSENNRLRWCIVRALSHVELALLISVEPSVLRDTITYARKNLFSALGRTTTGRLRKRRSRPVENESNSGVPPH